ncbi:MAG: ATP-grasp domain-containing protein [Dehalococcoidia bacterium]
MDFNILLDCVGRRVPLVRHFRDTLTTLGVQGKVVATDMSPLAPALYEADCQYKVPSMGEPSYLSRLYEICQEESVKLVVPLVDPQLPVLAEHRQQFVEIGTVVLVSSPAVIRVAADKRLTHGFFVEHGFAAAQILDCEHDTLKFPVMVKPANGSASIGIAQVHDQAELDFFIQRLPDAVIQEYLEGDEYTLDILIDFSATVRCVVPRRRIETRAGEVSKGATAKNYHIIDVGRKVGKALARIGAVGPLNIQGFLTPDGIFKLTEINPRFGGGFPLSLAAEADFPRWIIEMLLGRNPTIGLDLWKDGVVMLRYEEAIFTTSEHVLQ